jgi:hypothetical protein
VVAPFIVAYEVAAGRAHSERNDVNVAV